MNSSNDSNLVEDPFDKAFAELENFAESFTATYAKSATEVQLTSSNGPTETVTVRDE